MGSLLHGLELIEKCMSLHQKLNCYPNAEYYEENSDVLYIVNYIVASYVFRIT